MHHRTWVALAATMSFAAFPAAAAAGWLPAQTVGVGEAGPNSNTQPQVAMNARGDAVVATGSPNIPIALSTRAADAGAFGAVGLPPAFAGLERPPSVALGDDGTVLLGTVDGTGDGVLTTSGPLPGPMGAAETIATEPSYADAPKVAVAGDGTAIAVWRTAVAPEYHTMIRWALKPPGGLWSAIHATDLGPAATFGDLSVSDDGHALITYNTYAGAAYAISRAPGGDFGAPERVSAAGDVVAPKMMNPDIAGAVARDGAAIIAFATADKTVLVRRAAGSAAWDARTVLASGPTVGNDMVANDDGDFLMSYETPSYHAVLVTGRIHAVRVTSHDVGVGVLPALAVSDDGTATAVWSTVPHRLMTVRRSPGDGWTAPRAIDDPGDTTQLFGPAWAAATVAADDAGHVTVGWQAQSGNYRVRRFDPAVPDATPDPPVFDAVSIPAAVTRGSSVSFSARVHGDSPVTVDWVFSDGPFDGFGDLGGATGTDIQRTFWRAGPHEVTVTAIDADGVTTSITRTFAVTDAPPQDGPPENGPPAGQGPPTWPQVPPPHHDPPHDGPWHGPSADDRVVRVPELGGAGHAARCVVPDLRHHTLTGAKAMLRRARCALGRTTSPRRIGRGRLVVRTQSPRPGAVAAAGARVHVTLRAVGRR